MNVEERRKIYDFHRREEGKFDAILKVEKLEFFVMRHHVGNYSPVLFDKLCKAEGLDKNTVVDLEECSAEAFQIFLELINGWNRLDDTNIEKVIETLAHLKARLPLRLCEEYLQKKTSLDMKTQFRLADKGGLETLKNDIFSMIIDKDVLPEILPDDVTTLQKDTLITVFQKSREFLREEEMIRMREDIQKRMDQRNLADNRVREQLDMINAQMQVVREPGPRPGQPWLPFRDRPLSRSPQAPVQPVNVSRDRRPQRSPSTSPSLSPPPDWPRHVAQRGESPARERSLSPPLPGFRRYFPRSRSPSPDPVRHHNDQGRPVIVRRLQVDPGQPRVVRGRVQRPRMPTAAERLRRIAYVGRVRSPSPGELYEQRNNEANPAGPSRAIRDQGGIASPERQRPRR